MIHYLALIDQTPDIFGVVIPDCPGCYAAGHTFEEAVCNAAEALDEWLADRLAEGIAPPDRRGIGDLRADPSLVEDFADGAVLALIPTAIGSASPDPGLDARLMAEVTRIATRSGMTVAGYLAAAAREKIALGR